MAIRIKIPRVADVKADMEKKGITFYMLHKRTDVCKAVVYQFSRNEDIAAKATECLVEFINTYEVKGLPIPNSSIQDYMTIKEVCAKLNISSATLRNWTKKGVVTSYKVGSRVLYYSNEIFKTPSKKRKTK